MRFACVLLIVAACDPGALSEDDGGADDDGGALDDGALESLSTDCTAARTVVCLGSRFDCSYAAARCDDVPRATDRVSKTTDFPLDGTGHVVEDSLGNPIGTTTAGARTTHLNWGQRRVLHGTRKVLAWAVPTDHGAMTGWINGTAIARDLSWMPSATAPDPGGTTSTWHLIESDDAPYRDSTGASLKVLPTCGAGRNATDYLARNGRVNLIFNLPGYSPALGSGTVDVYPIAAGLRFDRAEAQPSIARPLWSCASGAPVATKRVLRFLYGRVEGAPDRHGWMAEPALAPGP
jgi:hypothetical protein